MNSHPGTNYIRVEFGFIDEEYQEEFVLTQLQTAVERFVLDKMSTVDIDLGELQDFIAGAERIADSLEIPFYVTDDVSELIAALEDESDDEDDFADEDE